MMRKDPLMGLEASFPIWFLKDEGNHHGVHKTELAPEINRYIFQTAGRLFFFYVNDAKDTAIKDKITFKVLENLARIGYDATGKRIREQQKDFSLFLRPGKNLFFWFDLTRDSEGLCDFDFDSVNKAVKVLDDQKLKLTIKSDCKKVSNRTVNGG